MSGLIVRAMALFVWTRALGAIGRRVGPRRVGLLLGLPSTTALALWSCGRGGGSASACVMADAGLLGLAAAVSVPVAYAREAVRGRGAGWAFLAAAVWYAAVALGLGGLPEVGTVGRMLVALSALVWADWVLRRGTHGVREAGPRPPSGLVGAMAPAACLMVVSALREVAGAAWAGLLAPFPAATTALLIASHAEGGPAAAYRVAAAVPRGSLGTLVFLAVFRSLAAALGMGGASGWAVAAAVATLLAVEVLTRATDAVASPACAEPRSGSGPPLSMSRRRRGRLASPTRGAAGRCVCTGFWAVRRPTRLPSCGGLSDKIGWPGAASADIGRPCRRGPPAFRGPPRTRSIRDGRVRVPWRHDRAVRPAP